MQFSAGKNTIAVFKCYNINKCCNINKCYNINVKIFKCYNL